MEAKRADAAPRKHGCAHFDKHVAVLPGEEAEAGEKSNTQRGERAPHFWTGMIMGRFTKVPHGRLTTSGKYMQRTCEGGWKAYLSIYLFFFAMDVSSERSGDKTAW